MPENTCEHPDRPHCARGLCRNCYEAARQRQRRAEAAKLRPQSPFRLKRKPTCKHQTRAHHAHGLCKSCYDVGRMRQACELERATAQKRRQRWAEAAGYASHAAMCDDAVTYRKRMASDPEYAARVLAAGGMA